MTEQTQAAAGPKWSGLRVLAAIAVPLVIVLAVMLRLGKLRQHPLHLKTCLTVADSLRTGAEVRISGVEVGIVRKVQVRPDDRVCPIALEMELQTPYEMKVPRDSKAYAATAGVLGAAYVGIDSSAATDTPIGDWGTLPSKVVPQFGAEEFLKDINRSLIEMDSSLQKSQAKKKGASTAPRAPK